MDLKGLVVAVTGGARGMGRAYVRAFLEEGARVAALDRSWEPTGLSGDEDDAFRKELESRDDALMLTTDIAQETDVETAYRATLEKFGTVDVLVNNAAIRQRDLFAPAGRVTTLQTSSADFQQSYAVNVFGTLSVTRCFTQPMIEKGRGSVVSVVSSGMLISSSGGGYTALRPFTREQPYMSSKAALANIMFYLADEVREYNIAVNIVIPGHTRTTGFDEQNAARQGVAGGQGRPPRAALRPEHMAPLVLFLARQDASGGVTGKMFDVMTWNLEHGLGGEAEWAASD